MRRAAMWAGVLALAAAVAGFARWPVAPAQVAQRLNGALGQASPLMWSAPQAATFSVLPWPNLRIVDARLDAAPGANVISAPEARIDLALFDLMFGQVAPALVTLNAPTITLDLDRPPFAGRHGAADAIVGISGFAPLGGVSLTDGVVRITSRKRGLDTVIESLRGQIEGLSPGARFAVDLAAVWRDAPLVLSGSIADPRRAARGRVSALRVSINSSLGELTFNGAVAGGAAPGAAGDLSVSSHALAEAARLFAATLPPILGATDVAISGKIKATPVDVTFDEAALTIGGQALQGALRLARTGDRLAISGSLDAERLTLAPLFEPPAPLLAPDGSWSERTFALAPPRDFDVDLRLSTGKADVYGVKLENVAASAMLKDGVLTANLIDATAYGGRFEGELHLACDNSILQVAARAKLAGADFGAAASGFGWPDMAGKGGGDFEIATAGRSPAETIAGLTGTASVELREGVVAGVNLEEALRRSQHRPLDLAKDMRSGGTAFERASLNLLIGKGVAHVVNGALVARGVAADLQGAIDLNGRNLSLRLNATQAAPTGAATPNAARLSFDIEGPWADPTVQVVGEMDVGSPGPAP